MAYSRFLLYNIMGGTFWVVAMTLLGFFFGNIPIVKKNFSFVIVVIIVISILPAVIDTKLHSKVDRGDDEESTQAYI